MAGHDYIPGSCWIGEEAGRRNEAAGHKAIEDTFYTPHAQATLVYDVQVRQRAMDVPAGYDHGLPHARTPGHLDTWTFGPSGGPLDHRTFQYLDVLQHRQGVKGWNGCRRFWLLEERREQVRVLSTNSLILRGPS